MKGYLVRSVFSESGLLPSMTGKRRHEKTAEIKVVVLKYLVQLLSCAHRPVVPFILSGPNH